MSSVALFINRGSACRDAIARAWHCQNGRQPRINDDEPHRIVAAAPLFFLSLTWQHTFRFSLSLYYNNSLHAQPSRGALVISASQFVSSWSLFGGNK